QHAVAGAGKNPAAMLGDKSCNSGVASTERGVRTLLIDLHEAAESNNVGSKYDG
ncbi:hypothetical protein DEV91_1541, partial [Phyllobacterium brassicacearum]